MYDVLHYIHQHIEEHLTVAELADRFGYTKWYFCDLFKRFTGTTVLEYIRSHRMQLAAMEILDGKKMGDVALKYGYDTQSGFNKAFLREFGCLPRAFCKQDHLSQIAYKERRKRMLKLSDRCAALRDQAVEEKPLNKSIWPLRPVLFQEGVVDCAQKGETDNHLLVASGIAHVIERGPAIVQRDELIVGWNYADEDDAVLGERLRDTQENRALMAQCGLSQEQIERFYESGGIMARYTAEPMLAHYTIEPDERWSPEDKMRWIEWADASYYQGTNHSVLCYEDVLKLGFSGLLKKVEAWEEKNGASPLYESMKILCRAGCALGKKYAVEIRKQLADESLDEIRRGELEKMEAVCLQVPEGPARTFWEAVQSLWFAHIINTWEDNINANSLGRLDQLLYPYYRQDIDQGRLTKEEAFELLCCLWIKLYRDYDVQQASIGGCKTDGSDAVNELSYLMLDATEECGFIRCLSVRFTKDTDKAFLKRALEVVGHLQKGIPFFFNDEVVIPALVSKGIGLEDARDYANIGCIESVIPGKSNPHASGGRTNLLKALEYTFNNGYSMQHPEWKLGLETGPLQQFDSYERFEAAVLEQVRHLVSCCCDTIARKAGLYGIDEYGINRVKPYKSLLTQGCMERGLDFNDKGAKYDYYQIMLGGIPNLADSLMVVKQFVYHEKRLTLQELFDQLRGDWPDEALRLDCLYKAPKFGNDIDEVDDLAARIIGACCDEMERAGQKYQMSFHAQPFTFRWMIEQGHETAATPDGRHAGETIAYSVSPMVGRDFNGVTALFNSLSKLPATRCPGTIAAIVEIDPKLFTDANIGRLADILRAAASGGLSSVQFNVVDADTLVDAQRYPEKYVNLAVRVSGFSQKFNLLDKELQDHIIGRTKHKCL